MKKRGSTGRFRTGISILNIADDSIMDIINKNLDNTRYYKGKLYNTYIESNAQEYFNSIMEETNCYKSDIVYICMLIYAKYLKEKHRPITVTHSYMPETTSISFPVSTMNSLIMEYKISSDQEFIDQAITYTYNNEKSSLEGYMNMIKLSPNKDMSSVYDKMKSVKEMLMLSVSALFDSLKNEKEEEEEEELSILDVPFDFDTEEEIIDTNLDEDDITCKKAIVMFKEKYPHLLGKVISDEEGETIMLLWKKLSDNDISKHTLRHILNKA